MKKWGVLIALIGFLAGPALAQHQLTQYTTLFSGAGTGDGTVRLDVQSFSSVLLKVRIDSTGTVNFKGSADGLDSTNLATCALVSDTAGTQVASTTASGDYFCSTANLKEVYINVSANGSGVTVNAIGSTASAKRGGGGGGSGTVTSVDASCGVATASGSAITSTGTIRGKHGVNAQTGTTYTILSSDCGKLITFSNDDPVSVTLPEAGTTGFEDGFFFQALNLGAGTVTITPATSTIQAAGDLDLTTGKSTTIASDGTNYVHAPGLGLTAEAQSLADVITINRTFGGAVSAATGPRFGSDGTGRYLIPFDDPTTGLALECETPAGVGHCDKGHTVQSTFKSFIADAGGARLTNYEPNAATPALQWALGTKKQLKYVFFPAGNLVGDGTNCPLAASAVTINSGPKTLTMICGSGGNGDMDVNAVMPRNWDGSDIYFEPSYTQTAANTSAMNSDIKAQCRGAGETPSSTWGSPVAIDDAAVTGSSAEDKTLSAAVTPAGTCDGGDHLYARYTLDVTGTTTPEATLNFYGIGLYYFVKSESN